MTTSTLRFGKLLQAIRKRVGLSQSKLAAYLNIDDSTITRMEAGTRKPPRDPGFFDKLRQVPGFTETDIAQLLSTEDSPRWLAQIRHGTTPEPISAQPRQIIKEEYRVTVIVEVDPTGRSEDEVKKSKERVEHLGSLVEKNTEWLLEGFIDLEEKRSKLLDNQ
jgi:transcriptional regulator with XRE-family HTH domain